MKSRTSRSGLWYLLAVVLATSSWLLLKELGETERWMTFDNVVSTAIALAIMVAVLASVVAWKRASDRTAQYQVIEIRVPLRWYRAAQNPVVALMVGALTCMPLIAPFSLFDLGRGGASGFDWRVITYSATTCLVSIVYVKLGAPVFLHAWNNRRAQPSSKPV